MALLSTVLLLFKVEVFAHNIIGDNAFTTTKMIIPIGISFYTLSAISYLVDICKKNLIHENSLVNIILFLTWFPKMLAGPVVKYRDFRKNIYEYEGVRRDLFCDGIQFFAVGLFKKIVLADRLSVFVNDVYHAPYAFSSPTIILATISYSLQIYYDFSGYSDMAIGMSKIFGFEIGANFNHPYTSKGFSDFWRRWHISLSSWLMEYIYFPLGGGRRGTAITIRNIFLTMIVSAIWHGIGLTYLVSAH